MTLYQKFIMFLATGFFSGKIPFAPGTFGTLAAVPVVMVFKNFSAQFYGIFLVGLILAAVYLSDQAEKILGKKDPGCIVIDEIAGYAAALSLVPVQMGTLVAGFVLFRFFDIVKPGPVRYFEKNFSGGAGVVLDDVMAGFLSAVVLRILYVSGVF